MEIISVKCGPDIKNKNVIYKWQKEAVFGRNNVKTFREYCFCAAAKRPNINLGKRNFASRAKFTSPSVIPKYDILLFHDSI